MVKSPIVVFIAQKQRLDAPITTQKTEINLIDCFGKKWFLTERGDQHFFLFFPSFFPKKISKL